MAALVQSLVSAQSDGPALASSTAATTLLPTQAKLTLPASYFDYPGRRLRVTAQGRISNIVTTPGTLTLELRFGSTIIFSGGAMQLSTVAHTDVPWWWTVELTVRAVGSTASFMGQGMFCSQAANVSSADSITGHSFVMTPNTAPAIGTTFASGTAMTMDLYGKFSVSDPANAITLHQYEVQSNVLY